MTSRTKKPNNPLLLCALLCVLLLAVPWAAAAVQGRVLQSAALPKPEAVGTMSDEVRADPVRRALWSETANALDFTTATAGADSDYTVLKGKLRQAEQRGLISAEKRDHLIAVVELAERERKENWQYCYQQEALNGSVRKLTFFYYVGYYAGEKGVDSYEHQVQIELEYLDKNGAFLSIWISDFKVPQNVSAESDAVSEALGDAALTATRDAGVRSCCPAVDDFDAAMRAFAAQLNLTPGDGWTALSGQTPTLEHAATGIRVTAPQSSTSYSLAATLPDNKL